MEFVPSSEMKWPKSGSFTNNIIGFQFVSVLFGQARRIVFFSGTGDYSRRIRRQSPKPETVAEIGDYSLQCGQGFTDQHTCYSKCSRVQNVRTLEYSCTACRVNCRVETCCDIAELYRAAVWNCAMYKFIIDSDTEIVAGLLNYYPRYLWLIETYFQSYDDWCQRLRFYRARQKSNDDDTHV